MRTWATRATLPIALLVGVALALVPAGTPRGGRALTGFERRGGTSWTTTVEERDYLRALTTSAAGDRAGWAASGITVRRVGTSARGRAVDLITLTSARPVADPIRVLFVCGQHGDEPAGREACLKLIRDLAFDRSAAGRRLLERVTVSVLPTPNPDGLVAGTRATSTDADLNRDHLALVTPEARAIRRVIRELRPHVVHDLHEFDTPAGTYSTPTLYLWPRNPNVDPAVRSLSVELARDRIGPALRAAGWGAGVYGRTTGERPPGEDTDERMLRNAAALEHAVAVLVEVQSKPVSPLEERDAGLLGRRRAAAHMVAARATLRMAAERADAIVAATRESRERAELGGAIVRFDDPEAPDEGDERRGEATIESPCAYRLSRSGFEGARLTLSAHGIRVGSDLRVETAQPAGALIPLLLDVRAPHPIADAVPVDCADDARGGSA